MNRKKKLNQNLNLKIKKLNAKLRAGANQKPKYIAKAEREKMTEIENQVVDQADSIAES